MKLNYANQLTYHEFKDLYSSLANNYQDYSEAEDLNLFGVNSLVIEEKYSSIKLNGSFDVAGEDAPLEQCFEIDDFQVYDSDSVYLPHLIKSYRKYMFAKFGDQYAIDCFRNDCEDD